MSKRKIAESNRGFKGIWIPAKYWLDEDLTTMEMLFLVEIDSLSINDNGCFASNKHFSNFFGVTSSRSSQIISSLKEKGYIKIFQQYDGKQIVKRTIYLVNKLSTPIKKTKGGINKIKGGYLENCEDSNTKAVIQSSNTNNNVPTCVETVQKSKKSFYEPNSEPYVLAKLLEQQIKTNLADYDSNKPKKSIESKLQKWANDARLMIEKDNRTFEQIKYLIIWCQKDNFWKANIMSMSKLRKQFDRLALIVKSEKEKQLGIKKQKVVQKETLPDWAKSKSDNKSIPESTKIAGKDVSTAELQEILKQLGK